MSLFERIGVWLWTLGEGVQPAAPEISNDVAPVTIDTPTDDDLRVLYEWLTVGDYWQVPPEMFAVRRLCFNGAPNHAFMVLRALVGAR